jgi:hypothetical protein
VTACWPEEPRPKGAGGLSPGFQPWEPPSERCALKGWQIEPTNNAAVKASGLCRVHGVSLFLHAKFTRIIPRDPTQAGSLCYIGPSRGCLGFVELAPGFSDIAPHSAPHRRHADTFPSFTSTRLALGGFDKRHPDAPRADGRPDRITSPAGFLDGTPSCKYPGAEAQGQPDQRSRETIRG